MQELPRVVMPVLDRAAHGIPVHVDVEHTHEDTDSDRPGLEVGRLVHLDHAHNAPIGGRKKPPLPPGPRPHPVPQEHHHPHGERPPPQSRPPPPRAAPWPRPRPPPPPRPPRPAARPPP